MALTDLTRISTSGIATGSTIDAPILRKDVSFHGSQVGVVSALFDSSDDALEFNDNVKLKIGTHGDIEIYNDGTKSVIKNGGSSLGGNNDSLHFYSHNDILTNSNYSQYFHCGAANENSTSLSPSISIVIELPYHPAHEFVYINKLYSFNPISLQDIKQDPSSVFAFSS